MKKLRLVMVLHGHQPVGNLEDIFRSACEKCYEPVLSSVKEHRDIHLGLHFSGVLLEWIENNRPTVMDMICELVSSRQVELLGGGMYEPILSAIPEADAVTQLDLMSSWLYDRFGVRPKGAWLAERIWEPQMVGLLSRMGHTYTLVDEIAIQRAAILDRASDGYWTTEQAGQVLNLFPIDKSLRYSVPFKPIDHVMGKLEELFERYDYTTVTLSDDMEKLGMWSGTEKTMLQEKWWDNFLSSVVEASDWLETKSPLQVIESSDSRGRVYPPSSSYEELESWALPFSIQEELAIRGKDNLRPGTHPTWHGFLAKYPEADRLHKKMLLVSAKLLEALDDDAPWEDEHEQARYSLLEAQCHCAYWHGLFGGLYLPHLRHAVYSRLIKAESILDCRSQGDEWISYDETDLDSDGKEEILLESALLSAHLDPNKGGVLAELDFRPSNLSLTDTMTRRKEYNLGIEEKAQDEQAEVLARMVQDRWTRKCFMDRFPSPATTLEELQSDSYVEEGDFLDTPYSVEKIEIDEDSYEFKLSLSRNGTIARGDVRYRIVVEKFFTIPGDQAVIQVLYRIRNTEDIPIDLLFCPELNLSLSPGEPSKQHVELDSMVGPGPRARSSGEHEDAPWIALVDDSSRLRLDLHMQPSTNVWRFPIETVSRSDRGWETNNQGYVLVPRWEMTIPAGASQQLFIRLSIGRTEDDTVVPIEIEQNMD